MVYDNRSVNTNRQFVLLAVFVIAVAFGVLNIFTPEYLDDYLYKFIFLEKGVNTNFPITTLDDILTSQCNHYFCFNGRVIVHFMVQLFSGMLGKGIFNVFNAICFTLLVFLMTRISSKINVLNICFCTSLIFLLFPSFKDCALWMTGSINYMWSSTGVCLFLYWLMLLDKVGLKNEHILWGVLCVFIGWSHEGIAFPLALSLFIYSVVNYKTIHKKAIAPLIVGFCIGTFLCTFSPATLSRGAIDGNLNFSLLATKLIAGLTLCTKLKAMWFLFLLIIFFILKRKELLWLKKFYFNNLILCNAYVLSFGVIFFSGFTSSRTAIAEELFAIVLLLKILEERGGYHVRYVKFICIFITSLLYAGLIHYSQKNYTEYKDIVSQIERKKSSIILTNEVQLPLFLKDYIRKPLTSSDSEFYDGFCYSSDWNHFIASTYHCDSLIFVPTLIYNDMKENNPRITSFAKQHEYPFYVIPVPLDFKTKEVTYILEPSDFSKLPFYIRPVATKMMKYHAKQIPADRKGYVVVGKQKYLLVGKNHLVDDRLKNIKIE